MATLTFDTHAAVKVMRDAGVDEPLAESIVAVIRMAKAHRDNLVTKAVLHTTLNAAMKDLERRLTIRTGAMIFAAAGLAVAATKLF